VTGALTVIRRRRIGAVGRVRLQKDASPRVRAAALHAEQDACLIEQLDANLDRAAEQGWRYSDKDWVRAKRRRQATRYWLPL